MCAMWRLQTTLVVSSDCGFVMPCCAFKLNVRNNFGRVLLVPQTIVMDLNNVMFAIFVLFTFEFMHL